MSSTIAYLGKEELTLNECGEKTKNIVFSSSFFYVEQKSVKFREFYQAMATSLVPEIMISMNKYEFYDYMKDCDKRYVRLQSPITNKLIDYTVIRTYEPEDDESIEIVLSRGIENVGA